MIHRSENHKKRGRKSIKESAILSFSPHNQTISRESKLRCVNQSKSNQRKKVKLPLGQLAITVNGKFVKHGKKVKLE